MSRADEVHKMRNARLNAKALDRANRLIADEYERLGLAPVTAGDVLVSPELAEMLDKDGMCPAARKAAGE
jgi:hypothetical protein